LKAKKTPNSQPDWRALALSAQTLVIYMGVIRCAIIQKNLIKHGRVPSTPVAIIENGSRPQQRVVTGTLENLSEISTTNKIGSPALIIIGEVVALHRVLTQSKASSAFS
jgi:uroporphyrin-III C-methyltransferase/precorrin-2 dehydrogenase/sirohydrochlorin ferrochelatase